MLGLLTGGLTNREIGEALFISEKTASVHVSNILGKLGVGGRGAAVAMALRLGFDMDADQSEREASAPLSPAGIRTSRRAFRTIRMKWRRWSSGRMCDGAP